MDRNEIIRIINETIIEFSNMLNEDLKDRFLKEFQISTANPFCLKENDWKELKFPGTSGVYFIFGINQSHRQGIYIGKASFSSSIGFRLVNHLNNPERNFRIYPMKDKNGEPFLMDYVIAINMDEYYYFASALEEFLISKLQEKYVPILNSIGHTNENS